MRLSKFIILLNMSACCQWDDEPSPPYRTPDNTFRYTSDTYRSVDFTYYCRNGRYVSVTYATSDKCEDYSKNSEFTSDGICPTPEQREILNNLTPRAQREYLISQGIKISGEF